jgi:hypothetical protein
MGWARYAQTMRYGPMDTACYVNKRTLNPRLLDYTATYDVPSTIH